MPASDRASDPAAGGAPAADVVEDAIVVLLGVDAATVAACRESLGTHRVEVADSFDAADALLGRVPCAVLLIQADDSSTEQAVAFVERLAADHSFQRPAVVLLGVDDRARLQALVQEDRLFYASPGRLDAAATARLADAARDAYREQMAVELAGGMRSRHPRALERRRLLGLADSLRGATRLAHVVEPVREALDALLGAADDPQLAVAPRLWQLDAGSHVLHAIDAATAGHEPIAEASAASGLVGWTARTGAAVCVERARSDPRFDADVDSAPEASDASDAAETQLLTVPIPGPEGSVLGVLALTRRADQPAFDAGDRRRAAAVAEHLAPVFSRHAPRVLDAALRERAGGPTHELFRRQAIEAHGEGLDERGSMLRLTPRWARWTWRLLLVGLLAALLFAAVAPLRDEAAVDALVVGVSSDGEAGEEATVVALVSPRLAAALAPGREVTFAPHGLPSEAPTQATVRAVGELLAPGELAAAVGPELAAAAPPGQPMVRLEATLPAALDSHGRSWRLRPGLRGTLRVELGSRSLLDHLLAGAADG